MGGIRKEISFSPEHLHGISLARSFDHLNRLILELLIGVMGIWFLLGGGETDRIVGLGVAWAALVASETLSSGAGWGLLYHFGPGVLIGAIFFISALPAIWHSNSDEAKGFTYSAIRAATFCALLIGVYSAWHVTPSGDRNHPRYVKALQRSGDLDRYIHEIESEFSGFEPEKVLLGVGNWVYLQSDTLQKDRAVSLADQPFAGIYENFDFTLARIRGKAYDKILLQNFNSPRFLYEWELWKRPSGFREAILDNYVAVKQIAPPADNPALQNYVLMADEVTVFVPR
jgi:hypothetical protein